jgi:hypothetical protein
MDAAAAAAMSDPDRNPHFRRRWREQASPRVIQVIAPSRETLGAIGIALVEAWRREQVRQQDEVAP